LASTERPFSLGDGSGSPVQPALRGWRLAHAALGARDPEAAASFYEDCVGLAVVDRGEDGTVYMTTDANHHCLALEPAEARALHRVAFELPTIAELERVASALDNRGVERVEAKTKRGCERAVAYRGPEGLGIELLAGVAKTDAVARARTLRPLKVGHVGVRVADIDAALHFYTEVMGFRLSDWIGHSVVFLRCNSDHHALVLVADAPAPGASALHHLAFEGDGWESFRHQADSLAAADRPLEWGPGRHAPSGNLFMYFRDDEGNRIEWMSDAGRIWDDQAREARVYDPAEPSTWNVWQMMPPAGFMSSLDEDEPVRATAPIG
jgi:catechol-2,3-dioxygenase